MSAQTVHEAAASTGWSPRMLRYVEQLGLVSPPRSAVGYRLYGPAQLHRLRTLRELLERHGLDLGDVGLALRLRREPGLAAALDGWFAGDPRADPHEAGPAGAEQHEPLPDGADDRAEGGADDRAEGGADDRADDRADDVHWLRFEQDRHEQLRQHQPAARTPTATPEPFVQTGTP